MRYFILLSLFACQVQEKGVIVVNNRAPEVNIISHPSELAAVEGEQLLFSAKVSDPDTKLENLRLSWRLDDQVVCGELELDENYEADCTIEIEERSQRVIAVVEDDFEKSGEDFVQLSVTPNLTPNLEVISPRQDGRYYLSHDVPFLLKISDPEDTLDALKLRIFSSIDGVLDASSLSVDQDGIVQGGFPLSEGEHELAIELEDQNGNIERNIRTLFVYGQNTSPVCELIVPSGQQDILRGDLVRFEGGGADDDIPPEWLRASWKSNIDGVLFEGILDTNGESHFETTQLSPGYHQIVFAVQDDVFEACVDTVDIEVNSLPEIERVSPEENGMRYTEGELVPFHFVISDETHAAESIFVSVLSSQDGTLYSQRLNTNGILFFETDQLSTGSHEITVSAKDGAGGIRTESFGIEINTPPYLETPLLTGAYAGVDLVPNIQAQDVNGDVVQIRYRWSQNGQASTFNSDRIPGSVLVIGDTWTLAATPNDGFIDGETVIETIIVSNAPPQIASHQIVPATSIYNDSVVNCIGVAYDPSESVSLEFVWYLNGEIYSGSQLDLSLTDAQPEDVLTCQMRASDPQGQITLSFQDRLIENRSPTISNLRLDPAPIFANEPVSCLADIDDPDQDQLVYLYEWTINGASMNGSQTLNAVTQIGDVISCILTVSDPYGLSLSDTVQLVVENQPPVISNVYFNPDPPTFQSPLYCLATGFDREGDSFTYSFQFENMVTGQVAAASSGGGNIGIIDPAVMGLQPADEVKCIVTATDDQGRASSASVVTNISDAVPTITAPISVTPAEAYIGDSLTCALGVTDTEDGDLTPQYEWRSNATIIGTGPEYVVDADDIPVFGHITCVATAEDSSGNRLTRNKMVPILNSVPVIQSIVVSPSVAYIDSTLGCAPSIFDADEQIVPAISWYLNQVLVSTSNTVALQSYLVEIGDTITCSVMGTDSAGATTTDSVSLVVRNRAPAMPVVTIDPIIPIVGEDDLTCTYSGDIEDADGDAVNYSLEWYRDGVLYPSTDSVIPTSELSVDEEWICLVTPDDGLIEGIPGQALVFTETPCFWGDCDRATTIAGTGMDWVLVPSGLFEMGSVQTEVGRSNREDLHYVYLTNDLWVMSTEVTQELFQAVMGYNPSFFGQTPSDTFNGGLRDCGVDCPVEYVTWNEAAYFANIVTAYVNVTAQSSLQECYTCTGSGASLTCSIAGDIYSCDGYRLPTEAEWEYFARAGSSTAFPTANGGGNILDDVDPEGVAWMESCGYPVTLDDGSSLAALGRYCYENIGANGDPEFGTMPVAQKQANAFRIYDVLGNVREWTNDVYSPNLGNNLVIDPLVYSAFSENHVTRGGYWGDLPQNLRSAARFSNITTTPLNGVGFRLVQTSLAP